METASIQYIVGVAYYSMYIQYCNIMNTGTQQTQLHNTIRLGRRNASFIFLIILSILDSIHGNILDKSMVFLYIYLKWTQIRQNDTDRTGTGSTTRNVGKPGAYSDIEQS
jgi:hypothetical protein